MNNYNKKMLIVNGVLLCLLLVRSAFVVRGYFINREHALILEEYSQLLNKYANAVEYYDSIVEEAKLHAVQERLAKWHKK